MNKFFGFYRDIDGRIPMNEIKNRIEAFWVGNKDDDWIWNRKTRLNSNRDTSRIK